MARGRIRATASRLWRAAGRVVHALATPTPAHPNGRCPVCERPIHVFRGPVKRISLQPHPVELIEACRRQNGTAHSRRELARALERRRHERPATYTEEIANLRQRLRDDT